MGNLKKKIYEDKDMTSVALKVAYGGLQYSGLSRINTFGINIEFLYNLYERTGDERYLENAKLHMDIYMKNGYTYHYYERLFDQVLEGLGMTDKKEYINSYRQYCKYIKPTRNRLDSIIYRWYPSATSKLRKPELISEIIDKIERHEKGVFTYVFSYGRDKYEFIYELVINDDECYMYVSQFDAYYYFEN